MSGLEVPGLVIGILPLVLKAIQHYDEVLSPFQRYKRFTEHAGIYTKELSIQKTIFRNECRILLEAVVDHDTASVMLNAPAHETWLDPQLEKGIGDQLGDSKTACITIIGLVESRLREVSCEGNALFSVLDQERKATPKSARNRQWRQDIGIKLGFCFSKTRLQENIAALRSYNSDLTRLAAQTRHQMPIVSNNARVNTRSSRKTVQRYRKIGEASRQVYEALGEACTKHTEHTARFCFEAEEISVCEETPTQIKFNLAFTHLTLAGLTGPNNPIWFALNTIFSDHAAKIPESRDSRLEELGRTLKRQFDDVPQVHQKKSKKCVRFDTLAAISKPESHLMAGVTSTEFGYLRKNFCDTIRNCLRQPCNPNTCIGILGDANAWKNFLYPSQLLSNRLQSTVSLGQFMESTSTHEPVAKIPVHERMGFARRLATAFLQYHDTPWLKLSWRSEDIFFFTEDDSIPGQEPSYFRAPYINTKIRSVCDPVPKDSASSPSLARNHTIFSLGILLLEIAHGTKLEHLQQPCDRLEGAERFADFFTARRIAKYKNTVMGLKYHKIAEQLVECAFPGGDDLSDDKMQVAFHQDVISPLEELEKGMRELYIDD